ncbi:GNAT family N-acetyltransferase [Flavobacterium terrigena]|uniref:Ribosomal-protein-alanine N-acetyltransferase n=1 Tax=Flavobacterium terrigena TaxID=402734 RepID=A0A1H6QQ55_9FLAO|nr:GNAT family protein [Flavobacterium terrigena]SEI45928.1 ribosomal-protein-alanine N-acetyltransferase [Flavobacterium terrigena]
MNFETLETERLILRKLSPEDFKYVFANYSKDEIMSFFGFKTEEEFQTGKQKSDKGYATHNRSIAFFQLIDKTSNAVIGACGFNNWYFDHRRAEIGYNMIGEGFKNQGFMSEALEKIIDYGFTEMNLHRIEALVGTENIPSLKLMKKFGFTQEGVLKQHYFINDKFEDSVIFSRLVSDT